MARNSEDTPPVSTEPESEVSVSHLITHIAPKLHPKFPVRCLAMGALRDRTLALDLFAGDRKFPIHPPVYWDGGDCRFESSVSS